MQHYVLQQIPLTVGSSNKAFAFTAFVLMLLSSVVNATITGYYYDQDGIPNQFFSGDEVVQEDDNIDFNWGGRSPTGGIGRNNFSVRWIGEITIPESGDWTFTTRTDDGVRLWIDGVQLIDEWADQNSAYYSGVATGLVAGESYSIVMEMYESTGNARAELYWEGPVTTAYAIVPPSAFNPDSTPPALVSASSFCLNGEITLRFSETITQASAENLSNYSADSGVVITGATINADESSVTLTYFAGDGTYFNVTANNISDTSGNTMSAETLSIAPETNGLFASYYDQNGTQGAYFTGSVVENVDAAVDFDWGGADPIAGIPGDDFSVRWVGELEVPSDGAYTFYTVSDDGVRLYVNDALVIENWTEHAATTDTSVSIPLVAGERYPIVMEYFERGVQAEARLQWSGPGIAQQAIPTGNLFVACSATTPEPVGLWHLDELSWSGAGGEVVDSSGNNLNGYAVSVGGFPTPDVSNPAIAGNPGTCAYSQFTSSDGYLRIDDSGSSLLDMPTELTVTTWIYPTALPSSGLSTIISKDENFEFHLTTSGTVNWWWGGGDRELTSTSAVTLNAWNHIAITFQSGQQVLYINGQTAGTHTSTVALDTNNDPLFIGVDLAFNSRRFNGYIDEVQLFDSALSAFDVATIRDQTHPCTTISVDHYAINHSGQGVTCEAEAVTVTAHDMSDATVDVEGRTIQVSATSASPGWVNTDATWTLAPAGGAGGFSTPSAGVAEYTFAAGETSVTFALGNISEADIDIDVVDAGDSGITDVDGNALEDEILSFLDTGVRFYNDADNDQNADGTDPIDSVATAGTASTAMVLKAVQTNDETGACEARVLGDQTVNFAYECINPTSCVFDQDMTIGGSPVDDNPPGLVVDYLPVDLTFDAEGEAPLSFIYYDVGQIRLHAQFIIPASGNEPAITLTGTSGLVTVRPDDLVITAVESIAGDANPGTSASGDGFVAAGESFRVQVEAQNALGRLTPNFGQELTPELITLNLQSLVMPAGGNPSSLSMAGNFAATATQGRFENVAVTWPEVGTITINASITDGSYLSTGDVVGTTSGNIGRFYPDHFRLVSQSMTAGCAAGGFSYMSDQAFSYLPLSVNYTVAAENASNALVENYDDALGYPVDAINEVAEDSDNGVDLSGRANIVSGSWVDGEISITGSSNSGFRRGLVGVLEQPDGPYTDLRFGLQAAGSAVDDVDFIASSLNMNAATAGDCTAAGNCDAVTLGGTQTFYFSRLVGENAHGPETSPLDVALNVEIFDGSNFVAHESDSCTQISMGDIQFDGSSLAIDANRTVSVGGSSSTGSFASFIAGAEMTFQSGDAGLNFSAPGAGNNGSFYVDFDLSNYPWLRSDWNQNGDYADDLVLPSIEVMFGRYRGHDRIIYWREVLN